MDVLREAGNARAQRADAPHDEVDLYARLRRFVERVDDALEIAIRRALEKIYMRARLRDYTRNLERLLALEKSGRQKLQKKTNASSQNAF